MFFRKKESNDEVGPSRGAVAVLHKTAMFLLYPFRKPLRFITLIVVLAAVAFALPVVQYKVKPQEVHNWYWAKVKDIDPAALAGKFAKPSTNEKGIDQLVDMPESAKTVRRQIFEKASRFSAPQPVDVMAEEAADVVAFQPQSVEPAEPENIPTAIAEPVLPEPSAPSASAARTIAAEDNEGAVLRYLDEPEVISGLAKVHNANEMEVNGVYVFLYGIYSNPQNGRGVKAGVFLRSLVKGQQVKCNILAYTRDDVATAECFVGNVSINDLLVENGFSDKVSLE